MSRIAPAAMVSAAQTGNSTIALVPSAPSGWLRSSHQVATAATPTMTSQRNASTRPCTRPVGVPGDDQAACQATTTTIEAATTAATAASRRAIAHAVDDTVPASGSSATSAHAEATPTPTPSTIAAARSSSARPATVTSRSPLCTDSSTSRRRARLANQTTAPTITPPST